jgi:hypothetical protein
MPDDGKTFYIQFPGNIMLEVHLQNPHPVNLTVRFSDNSGVIFSYSPDSPGTHKGKAEMLGSTKPESGPFASAKTKGGTSGFDTRLRPATAPAAGAIAGSGGDVFILYNDPGGSRM